MRSLINLYNFILIFSILFFVVMELNSATVGLASWYGEAFHGKVTANGEKFDMTALTAAHKELPFNTVVRVTNLLNNRVVVVRINDRGPFRKDRIIDLSKSAAEKLDFLGIGVAPVKIEVLEKLDEKKGIAKENNESLNTVDSSKKEEPDISSNSKLDKDILIEKKENNENGVAAKTKLLNEIEMESDFYIQVGSYKMKDYAEKAYRALQRVGLNVLINVHGPFFTVFIPTSADDVHKNVELIKSTGYKDILVRKTKILGDRLAIE
ncbi:septal ring lytic transglycosylase RlpA family protein [Borrelia sp. A-FGy1]|uniref:septal ring lytic transglycosylase RlpA family protein n=1 Tax=Borrelia sp. A-FGy1 TaxID=2608247 RepID=UPI0015F53DEC|nr:septal ring lytic transglycosylase RlpA family protein [Borrelia sp. A-FGy1]QMU99482.1 septal ring lytic transglycosylase RlpA family protein [Borrelia sp. A-FGy1]